MDKSVYEGIERTVKPSETHFISKEGARYYCIPTFKTRDDEGKPVTYAAYNGGYYKMQRTITPFPEPIPFNISGKD